MGGSSFDAGPAVQGVVAQLAYAPFALLTGLFRPFLTDIRNPLMLVSSGETTAIALLLGIALARLGARRVFKLIGTHPALAFCVVFCIVLGTGVGLATTNMGTLVRYRTPLVPCLGVLAFTLYAESRTRALAMRARVGPNLRASR